jgi:hypothetical protein
VSRSYCVMNCVALHHPLAPVRCERRHDNHPHVERGDGPGAPTPGRVRRARGCYLAASLSEVETRSVAARRQRRYLDICSDNAAACNTTEPVPCSSAQGRQSRRSQPLDERLPAQFREVPAERYSSG